MIGSGRLLILNQKMAALARTGTAICAPPESTVRKRTTQRGGYPYHYEPTIQRTLQQDASTKRGALTPVLTFDGEFACLRCSIRINTRSMQSLKKFRRRAPAFVVAAFALFLSLCWITRRNHEIFVGTYQGGPEQSAFFLDGNCSRMPFWYNAPDYVALDIKARLQSMGKPAALRLKVLGKLSPSGKYGHLGGYPRQLDVTRIVSAGPAEPCLWPTGR